MCADCPNRFKPDAAAAEAGLEPVVVAKAAAAVRVTAMPTAEEWLEAFAAALGRDAPTKEESTAVLKLASVAAHASERRAAPIACWLAATVGMSLDEALALARRLDA